MPRKEPVFVFLRRNARGGLTRDARDQVKQLTTGSFDFKSGKNPDKKILQELRALLPKNVLISENNPFAVLKVTPTKPNQPQACMCKCGTSLSCGGGGGGSGLV